MRISVFGLGYVGTVCAACFAERGHTVIGVDPNPLKTDPINAGRSPIVEQDLDRLIREAVAAGRLRAADRAAEAIAESDLSFICVGTPSRPNGSLDLRYVRAVADELGAALRAKATRHLIVLRSTVLPGTTAELAQRLEAASGRRLGEGFGLLFHPEFLRESTAVEDFRHPPKTVIGAFDPGDAATLASLYAGMQAPLEIVDVRVAEMVKYVDNSFHALKITFANEIGALCRAQGVDSHEVMRVFCLDRKLNISPAYLKPGFAFGGSCLPKDLRALTHAARESDLELPVLDAVLRSNAMLVETALRRVAALPGRRIGVLGLAFKAGTDDLRESPIVELVERLLGKGYAIRLFDRHVAMSRLIGSNKAYIEQHLPHLSELLEPDADSVAASADTLIIANKDPEFAALLPRLSDRQHVLDLVRIAGQPDTPATYHGISW